MNAGQHECVGCGQLRRHHWLVVVSAVVSGPAPPPVTTGLTNHRPARWSVRPAAVSQPMGGQQRTAGTCTHTLDTGQGGLDTVESSRVAKCFKSLKLPSGGVWYHYQTASVCSAVWCVVATLHWHCRLHAAAHTAQHCTHCTAAAVSNVCSLLHLIIALHCTAQPAQHCNTA